MNLHSSCSDFELSFLNVVNYPEQQNLQVLFLLSSVLFFPIQVNQAYLHNANLVSIQKYFGYSE